MASEQGPIILYKRTRVPARSRTDIALQRGAERLHMRREYFDLREYMRSKTERLDLSANRRLNALFIHVPKCAGSSIERQIGIRLGHRTATYFLHADRGFFGRAFTFALVRDPFDRLVSAYHYLRNHTRAPLDIAWAAHNVLVNDRHNISTRGVVDDYYTPATARTVAAMYAEDFRTFGYDPHRFDQAA